MHASLKYSLFFLPNNCSFDTSLIKPNHHLLPDEVDDPPLCLLGGHVELLGQHGDGDALVDAAERLEDHQPRVLDEVIQAGNLE